MIFYFLLVSFIGVQNYLDSLVLKKLEKDFITENTQTLDGFEVRFIYRKNNLISVERKDLKENLDDKIVESVKKELSEKFEEKTEKRGTGLIPDISIPIPVELPFGLKEESKVKINGFQSLSMGVIKRSYSNEVKTVAQGSSSPEIQLNQHLKVNTEGIIGGKIHILLDHDSERESQDLNTIKIRYEGDEDEIIKTLEGGNKIGEGGGGGLFGLRGEFQLGPLNLEATISREVGNKKEIEFEKGGVREDSVKIEDKDFARDEFFILPLLPGEHIKTDSVYVFYDDNNIYNDTISKRPIIKVQTFLEKNPDSLSEVRNFELLTKGSEWDFMFLENIIHIKINDPDNNYRLAVYYKTNLREIGYFNPLDQNDTAKLMLIRDVDLRDSTNPTWDYMLRNIYYIGELSTDSGSIVIYKYTSTNPEFIENGKTYLQLLGLDNNGDGILDDQINYMGNPNFKPFINGYLFFPDFKPFASDVLSEKDNIIYQTTSPTELDNREPKYIIKVKTKRRPEVINLGFTRLIEGSEEVYFGGEKWERGKDYIIDYETGTMTILNDEYKKDFSRKLKIRFSESALFQTKKRTYINLKGKYDFGENTLLNFGINYRGETTAEQKIRLGEEPKRVLLFNSNFKLEKNLPFNFLSFLPWLKEANNPLLKLNVKYNQAFPDPNTKGYAFLDDMESSELEIELSLRYSSWIYGSLPSYLKDTLFFKPQKTENDYVNKLIWVETNEFTYGDIYPYIPGAQAKNQASVMKIIIRPGAGGSSAWASLTQLLSTQGFDLENYENIEIIVKGKRGIIGIDLATDVNEDAVFRDKNGDLVGIGELNTEDGANGGPRNGQYEAIEDVGLDMAPDGSPDDAGNDNFDITNIENINGTEGNGKLDTEDLDGNGFNLEDRCFTYVIDLSDPTQYYQENNGFKFYKIPIRNFVKQYGSADLKNIKKIRIFFTGFETTDTIYIAKLSITGNKYLSYGVFKDGKPVEDTSKKFIITTYSNQKDAEIYNPPPGVEIIKTSEGEQEEKTLVLRFINIEKDEYGIAIRQIPGIQDFWEYKKIKFYLKSPLESSLAKNLTFFIRFASADTKNFYEYRIKGLPTQWKEYEIDLEAFPRLKNKRKNKFIDSLYTDPEFPNYYVKGNPNLKKIDRYMVGVLNEGNIKASGEVWFNELIIKAPDRKGAYSFESVLNMEIKDIGKLTLNLSKSSAGFAGENLKRQLSAKESFGGNLSMNIDKLLNISFLRIPFSFSLSSNKELPIFLSGSDVKLTREQSEMEKTVGFNNSYNLSISRNITNQQRIGILQNILKYTIDPLNYNVFYQYSMNSSPINKTYNRNFQQSLSYSTTIPFNGITIFKQRINLLPKNVQFRINHSKVKRKGLTFVELDSTWAQTSNYKREGAQLTYNISGIKPLNSITIDFNGKIEYDFGLKKITGKFYGKDIKRSASYSLRYNPTLPTFIRNFFTPLSFTYTANFNDNHDPINQKDSLNPLRIVNNTSNYSINGGINTFEIISFFIKLGNPKALKDINKFRFLFQNININYNRTLNSRYFNLLKPPSFLYEIGKTMNPQVDYTEDINNFIQDNRNITASTGTRIFNVGITISYNNQKNFSFNPLQNSITERQTENFPNISIQADALNKRIKVLDKYLSTLSLKTNFNVLKQKTKSSGTVTEGKQINYSPLFSIQGRTRNGIGFSLMYNKSENTSNTYSGFIITETKNINTGIQGSIDFSISKGFTKKFMGFLKVRSDINARITFSSQNSKSLIRGMEQSNTSTTRLDGTLTFRFSEDITGSGRLSFYNQKDNLRGTQIKNFEFNLGIKINF